MNTEQKARAYDEALERAKRIISKNCSEVEKLCLKSIFPELAESEDEKVRKEIIEVLQFVPSSMWEQAKTNYERCFAYLEKQKDLDKMIVVSPEVWDNAISDAYENGKKDEEKQKEQKPVEKQDYSGLNDLERVIHRGFLAAGVENVPVTIIKETAQECLTNIKPAWSEEDEIMIGSMINYFEGDTLDCSLDCVVNWLKSISMRCPKSSDNWKPSEEQMRAVKHAYNSFPNDCFTKSNLKLLYHDLEKLM